MSELKAEELIERYIYEVTRRLPVSQREDISKELATLIDDMLEEREENGKSAQENTEAVLEELGAPRMLAAKYRGEKKYLIGPERYEQYLFVLKIVLISVGVGMAVAGIVQGATWAVQGEPLSAAVVAGGIGSTIVNVLMGLIQGFAWVTLVFALFERYALKIDLMGTADWKPQKLREIQIPTQKATLKKGDAVAGIVFAIAAMIVFNVVPYIISFFLWQNDVWHMIPIFNLEHLALMMPLLNICFALGIVRELLRVAVGRQTVWLGIATAALNMAALAFACVVFFDSQIWNPELMNQAAAISGGFADNIVQLNLIWDNFTRLFGWILIFGFVLDSAVSLYRGIRYGRKTN